MSVGAHFILYFHAILGKIGQIIGWCPPGVGGHCPVKYRPVTDELLISKDSQLPQSLRCDVSFFYRDHFVT